MNSLSIFIIVFGFIDLYKSFDLPPEIRIGSYFLLEIYQHW
jgi:hypothetical protein